MSTTRLVGAPPGPNRQAPGREDAAADRLPAVRGRRDIFPLPHVSAYIGEEVLQLRRDRGSRRMQWMIRQINCLVTALTWMHGFKGEDRELLASYPLKHSFGVVDPVRLGVLARLECAAQRGLGAAPQDPQTALSLILRGRSPYDVRPSAVTLAPFRLELLSLPDDVHDCPTIESLLPAEALSYLKGYQERMLRPAVDAAEISTREFMDPSLRYNQKQYRRLISELHRRGLVVALDYAMEQVGLFAVGR